MRLRSGVNLLLLLGSLPLLFLLLRSLAFSWRYPALLPEAFSPAAWQSLFTGAQLSGALMRSFFASTLTAFLATAVGFITSRTVARHLKHKPLIFLTHIPFLMAPPVLAIGLLPFWLNLNLAGTLAGVLLAQFLLTHAYAVLYFQAFWNRRMRLLEELTLTLGASKGQLWRRVLLPQARPFAAICLLQTFLLAWFDYGFAAVIGAGKYQSLTVLVFAYLKEADQTLAATAACLLALPPMLLLGFGLCRAEP
ncbi:MAG: ABC transporter permease [Gammaproteobacteria bacterium HGW-Gammaproteobacteria-3]|nr:MAG: ABC transporter permease [Gammaproteobacteria bacterium HGW-Gammaproteobacteria-3]